jgi:hypothetical protein
MKEDVKGEKDPKNDTKNPEEMKFGGILLQFMTGQQPGLDEPAGEKGNPDEVPREIKSIDDFLKAIKGLSKLPRGDFILESLVNGAYDSQVGKYRPLLKLLPQILDLAGDDLITVVVPVYKALNDLAENKEIEAESARNRKIRAKKRSKAMEAYEDAGFTNQQAFELLVCDLSRGTDSKISNLIGRATNTLNSDVVKTAGKSAAAKVKPTKK